MCDGAPAHSPRAEPKEHGHVPSLSNYRSTYYSLLIKWELPPALEPGHQAQRLGWAGPLNGGKQGWGRVERVVKGSH